MSKLGARLRRIVGIPETHTEFAQILRYREGGYYRRHHDQWSLHWTPQGVRLFTLFVYLSTTGDGLEGGGTAFHNLSVTVEPKLGRGLLWPNYADDGWRVERETFHEALPVVGGTKFAFNLWFYQHDLQTNRGKCAYAPRANVQGAEWAPPRKARQSGEGGDA